MCIVTNLKHTKPKPFPSGSLIQKHQERLHKQTIFTMTATTTTATVPMIPMRCCTPPPQPFELVCPPSPKKQRLVVSDKIDFYSNDGTNVNTLLIPALDDEFSTPGREGCCIPNLPPRITLRKRKALAKTEENTMGKTRVNLAPALYQETPTSNTHKKWSDRHPSSGGLPHSPIMNSDHAIGA